MTVTHSKKKVTKDNNKEAVEEGKEPPKYHCDSCSRDVTNTVRIRCAHKDCPDFDVCVSCFCDGAEPMKHKAWHEYRVVKPHEFPIFSDDWDADEELHLIEGAEKFGIGNWQAIANYIGTKSKEECEQHYIRVYVESEDWPLPNMKLEFDISEEEFRERKRQRLHAMNGRSPGGPAKSSKPLMSQPTFHEIAGYMPRRQEFETEYENEAEHCVKDMAFNEEDTKEEEELKLMVLDIYNSKLDKREERKKFIIERGLLNYKANLAMEKKRSKEERDLHQRVRVYARLQTSQDYEMFIEGLLSEMKIRQEIARLQECRENGITTLSGTQQYDIDKKQRQSDIKSLMARQSMLLNERAAARAASRPSLQRTEEATQSRGGTPKPQGRKPVNPLNIKEAEGVHLLTQEEQILCSGLRLLPKPYLVIKDTVLKEYARLGSLKRKQCRELIKIDVNKTSKIYDFFVECGWVRDRDIENSNLAAAPDEGVSITSNVGVNGDTAV